MSVFKKKSREAEQAVIGAVMLNDAMLNESDLSASHFLDETHREIWTAVLEIHHDRQPIDLLTLNARLSERGRAWGKYLAEIGKNVPSAANWS